jgi:hypothetical protein
MGARQALDLWPVPIAFPNPVSHAFMQIKGIPTPHPRRSSENTNLQPYLLPLPYGVYSRPCLAHDATSTAPFILASRLVSDPFFGDGNPTGRL